MDGHKGISTRKRVLKSRHNSSKRNRQKKSEYDQEMPQSDTAEQQSKRTPDTKTIIAVRQSALSSTV